MNGSARRRASEVATEIASERVSQRRRLPFDSELVDVGGVLVLRLLAELWRRSSQSASSEAEVGLLLKSARQRYRSGRRAGAALGVASAVPKAVGTAAVP